jgi:hypothetical protein
VTAPDLGPCQCEVNDARGGAIIDHEHSDFDPYPCAEPGCGCSAHRPARGGAETGENPAQAAPGPAERPRLTIPADALDFSRERVTDAATWLDSWVHTRTAAPREPDDPLAVCAFADLLEQNWPEWLDPHDALAIAIRRLAATKPTPKQRAMQAIRHIHRRGT